MKRRLFLCIVWVLTVFSGLLPPLTAPVSADVNSDAAAFCKSVEPYNGKFPDGSVQNPFSNSQYDSCVGGYAAEKANNRLGETGYCNSGGFISSPRDCVKGWEGAKHNTPPAPPGTGGGALTTEAVVCGPFGGDKLTFCQQALDNQCSSYTAAHTTSTLNQKASDCFKGAWAKHQGQSSPCGSNAACKDGFTHTAAPAPAPAPAPAQQLGCEFQITNALTWIVCPIVFALTQTINFVDNLITNELNVKTNSIFCDTTDTCQAYYQAWQSFRDIALGLMAIAGLIIVIAQALGLEILDAYTIRKVLPRLLIAAIGISLSWPLMRFLIQLSDDLGFGVRHLIYAPFSSLNSSLDLSFGQSGIVGSLFGNLGGAGAAAAAIPAWLVLGGPAALLSFIGTALLAVFVAIVVLILRQVAIILLMLLSPLAIVSYIMPNTQRFYRMWWESFSKALLMFPLIAAMIATGRVFSAIAINNGGTVNQIVGFAAYFAPYLMIPLTFRMAGSAVGGLGSLVQSRASGGFQALNSLRANQRKSRLERVRGTGLYRKNTGLPGFLNKVGFNTLEADHQLPYILGSSKYTGAVGRKLFGRQAQEMAGLKARNLQEATQKAAEQADPSYHLGYAVLGMRNKLVDDLKPGGKEAMDAKYGIDKNGNRTDTVGRNGNMVSAAGLEAVRWRPVKDDDVHDMQAVAQDLKQYGASGSFAQLAGTELDEKAGLLSSFGLHMETQRAKASDVAAFTLAREGKLSPEDPYFSISALRNQRMAKAGNDPAAIGMADAQYELLQKAAAQNAHEQRRGKGTRIDDSGQAYSVYGDHVVGQRDDGTPIRAFESQEALEALKTARGDAMAASKGESWDNTRKAYIAHGARGDPRRLPRKTVQVPVTDAAGKSVPLKDASGRQIEEDGVPQYQMRNETVVDTSQLTDQEKELRKLVVVQTGAWARADPGARVKIQQTLNEMGISDQERAAYMNDYRSGEAANLAGGPQEGGEPPDAGAARA